MGSMTRWLAPLFLGVALIGCAPPPAPISQVVTPAPVPPPHIDTGGGSAADRYGPNAPERQSSFAAGSDKIVANWQLRSVFVEANGEFHDSPAEGALELRPDATCSGTRVDRMPTPFDGTYTLNRGWLEFSAYGTQHFDFIVTEGDDNGKPAYILKLSDGRGLKLTFARPKD
jgi:hypothetical protein